MVINWSNTCNSAPGGNCWPLAAALARAPVRTWSSSLRLTVKPSPLAITGSPNSAVMAAVGLAFVACVINELVASGLVAARAAKVASARLTQRSFKDFI